MNSLTIAPTESPQAPRTEWEIAYHQRLKATLRNFSSVLDLDFRKNPFRDLAHRFVLAHTPRVGSHLLCEHLSEYGAVVEEYFELPRIRSAARKYNFVSLQEYCFWLIQKYAANGIFGVSGGVKALAPLVLAGDIPNHVSEWRFVHLTREDFVARAVSEHIARLTGAFKSTKAPARALTDDDYDGLMLRRLIEGTLTFNAAWEGAFQTYGVEPYRLTYESLCDDGPAAAAGVAAHLGLEAAPVSEPRLLKPKLEKQSTSLNDRWAERFRAENDDFCQSVSDGVHSPIARIQSRP